MIVASDGDAGSRWGGLAVGLTGAGLQLGRNPLPAYVRHCLAWSQPLPWGGRACACCESSRQQWQPLPFYGQWGVSGFTGSLGYRRHSWERRPGDVEEGVG